MDRQVHKEVHMTKVLRLAAVALAALVASWAGDASAQVGVARCQGQAITVRAQSSGVRTTTVNFNTDQFGNPDPTGYFDPTPLIATSITTTGLRTCLIVHFSALVEPQDNHVMFQVRVDGVPMEGHAIFPYSVPTVQAPVVWDPEETDKNLTRMVAYNFFDSVGPGQHRVEVLFSGCCGLTGGVNVISLVRNAVMTLQF
jgi:hypothetical protein